MAGKEVRFKQLVNKSGKPEIVSLWTDPKRDRRFMKAVKEHRVLTVIQEPRTHRKDFGRPGFHPNPHASYLVFPKPLPVDQESRVIGITYDLAADPRVIDPVPKSARSPRKPVKTARIRDKAFNVILRRTGVVETSIGVRAANSKEAEKKALHMVKLEPFDGAKAVITNSVTAVQTGDLRRG
jgi:hypothetical protein